MTYRITQKDLDIRCRALNIKTNNPTEMFKEKTTHVISDLTFIGNTMNAGHFYTQTQSEGTRLEQISKPDKFGQGANDISLRGTKRETFNYINAMLKGIEHFENRGEK